MNQTINKHGKSLLSKSIVTLGWGIGYFFGYTLVTILTLGLCHSEEFSVLVKGRKQGHAFPVFKQYEKFYLEAECVALMGWMFASAMIYLALL